MLTPTKRQPRRHLGTAQNHLQGSYGHDRAKLFSAVAGEAAVAANCSSGCKLQRGRSQLDIRSSFLSGRWCSTGTGCLGVLELHQSSGEWVRHGHSRPDPLALVRALLQETYRSTNPTKDSVISWATPRSFHRD